MSRAMLLRKLYDCQHLVCMSGNEGSFGSCVKWGREKHQLLKEEQGERQNQRIMKGVRGGVKIRVSVSHESILVCGTGRVLFGPISL